MGGATGLRCWPPGAGEVGVFEWVPEGLRAMVARGVGCKGSPLADVASEDELQEVLAVVVGTTGAGIEVLGTVVDASGGVAPMTLEMCAAAPADLCNK